MRWRKDFPSRWLRKKRSAVFDVCGSDFLRYNVVPLTLTLSHQGRGDLLGEVHNMNTLPLVGGGKACLPQAGVGVNGGYDTEC